MAKVALIGFGEAGSTFATACGWGRHAHAYDIDPARSSAMRTAGVVACEDVRQACSGAEIVLSLVTADQALLVARNYAELLDPNTIWIDMNSVAPETKRQAATEIGRRGAHFVDAAILAPVHPARMKVPLLLAGPGGNKARAALISLGFANVRVVGGEIGKASAIKMIRSVMVKGIEALTDEMMAAAEAAGVADLVLASLDASEKDESWAVKAAYSLERMATHGARRAAEMEESADTLRSLGIEPVMTEGTVRRQREAATRKFGAKDAA